MKGLGNGMIIIALILSAAFIALAISQGQKNIIITNITNYQNITNDAGVSIPQANITTGITIPSTNLTSSITGFPNSTYYFENLQLTTDLNVGGTIQAPYITNTQYITTPHIEIGNIDINTTGVNNNILLIAANPATLQTNNIIAENITATKNLGGQLAWANVTNFAGISGIAQANLTGLTLPFTNITGSYGLTMPAANITNGIFAATNLTDNGNFTLITNLCLNANCSARLYYNGTDILINNSKLLPP